MTVFPTKTIAAGAAACAATHVYPCAAPQEVVGLKMPSASLWKKHLRSCTPDFFEHAVNGEVKLQLRAKCPHYNEKDHENTQLWKDAEWDPKKRQVKRGTFRVEQVKEFTGAVRFFRVEKGTFTQITAESMGTNCIRVSKRCRGAFARTKESDSRVGHANWLLANSEEYRWICGTADPLLKKEVGYWAHTSLKYKRAVQGISGLLHLGATALTDGAWAGVYLSSLD